MADRIRVLLADDHARFRQVLHRLLGTHPRLQIVADAGDAQEAIRLARELRPDVVLIDLHMPGGGGLEVTRTLQAELPDVAVVLLTASENEEDLLAALRAGAKGYVLKGYDVDRLLRSLDAVAAGQAALAPRMTTALIRHLSGEETLSGLPPVAQLDLTERERELLRLIGQGASNRQIAAQLEVSETSVRTELAHLLGKLGLKNRVQAAAYALRHGLGS